MSRNCDGKLVEQALNQALARRRPKAGLLHHSDRGSQYTRTSLSIVFRAIGYSRKYVA